MRSDTLRRSHSRKSLANCSLPFAISRIYFLLPSIYKQIYSISIICFVLGWSASKTSAFVSAPISEIGPKSFYSNMKASLSQIRNIKRIPSKSSTHRSIKINGRSSVTSLSTSFGHLQPFYTNNSFHSIKDCFYNDPSLFRASQTRLFSVVPRPAIDENELEIDDSKTPSAEVASNNLKAKEQVKDEKDIFHGLESRPIPGGTWDPENPLEWAKNFGARSLEETERLHKLANLKPDDEGYISLEEFDREKIPGVTVVRTREQAEIVLKKLMEAPLDLFHACDTEVMEIQLKEVGPVGNGFVTCASVYSGPDFDYGLGEGKGTALWIDNLDDAFGVLQVFKPWFEDKRFLKVWHNYGFDRHVMWNEAIDCQGFGGDTMHMARLQNTARLQLPNTDFKGYSLEALTAHLQNRRKKPMKEIFGVKRLRKDGTEGNIVDVPPVEILQRDPKFRTPWIVYSSYDAEGTWLIRKTLQEKLEKMPWTRDRKHNLYEFYHTYLREFGEVLTDMERRGILVDAKDYLAGVEVQARKDREEHLKTFQTWAAKQIGPDGLAINVGSSTQLGTFLFGGSANAKTRELTESVRVFKVLREEVSQEALKAYEEQDEKLKQENLSAGLPASDDTSKDEFDHMKAVQLKSLCKECGLKVSGKKAELKDRLRRHFLVTSDTSGRTNTDDYSSMSEQDLRDACITRCLDDNGTRNQLEKRLREDDDYAAQLYLQTLPKDEDGYKKISEALVEFAQKDANSVAAQILGDVDEQANAVSKYVDITISSIGMEPEKFTAGGAASCTADVLRALAGDPFSDPPKYGRAYKFFNEGQEGHDACVALYSLTAIGSIDTMIANFLTSLQSLADDQSRVHCSLNINTETGRLSSRRPNLQNQPALEKDKYQIRKAFQSSPGNRLIVADYGQLELRLLASMTDCVSMVEAFESGGDFHSRTALGMFDYIQKDVEKGDVYLEWDYSKGEPDKPMLKDKYASERRKAKTLNFSIAYGKTAHGLSQDWGVSTKEAEEMLNAWYKSRPEVEKWQKKVKKYAKSHGITRTLMGRYRQLPGAKGTRKEMGHAERASINTPIQGGAADVAMMAMIKINKSEILKRLGWILLMQIHDEVILEGPEETSEEAFKEVLHCMQSPWGFGLEATSVPLLVDGSHIHDNWYDAK